MNELIEFPTRKNDTPVVFRQREAFPLHLYQNFTRNKSEQFFMNFRIVRKEMFPNFKILTIIPNVTIESNASRFSSKSVFQNHEK